MGDWRELMQCKDRNFFQPPFIFLLRFHISCRLFRPLYVVVLPSVGWGWGLFLFLSMVYSACIRAKAPLSFLGFVPSHLFGFWHSTFVDNVHNTTVILILCNVF
jgi:hypothetical protein